MNERAITRFNAILDAQAEARQLMTIDEYLALGRDDPHLCELEAECYAAQGIEAWKEKRGELVQVYRCGWQSTDVGWCAKRKRYLKRR